MAKPRLEKVRALFYVLQHIQEGASNFDTPSYKRRKVRSFWSVLANVEFGYVFS